MRITSTFLLLFIHSAVAIKNANNKCPLRSINSTCNTCVQTVKNLSNSLLSLHNNTVHKLELKKNFDFGNNLLNVHLKQSEDSLPPVMYSNEGTLDPSVKPRLQRNFLELNELTLDYTVKLNNDLSATSNFVVDLPKTLQVTLRGLGGDLKEVSFNTEDLLKRLDFVLKYRNSLMGTSYNFRSREKTVELIQRFENLYKLFGKHVNVTPKLEVVMDKNNKLSYRGCLVFKRDNLTITPILHSNPKKCELAMEAKLTDEVKVGMFVNRDKNVYLNLSYESRWGKHSWQQFALRFVLSDVLKSYAYVHNEVQL
ncbi:hypothetical protein MACK_000336 [Theileria orientalis]|uniref:Uncharacterized protein n=1 Tax=Theileria orientalis TaxID=68886 RepID=A0A976M9R6_THEOR|nr:hypothetical protein MACK_000336 [Theileria orientalis]